MHESINSPPPNFSGTSIIHIMASTRAAHKVSTRSTSTPLKAAPTTKAKKSKKKGKTPANGRSKSTTAHTSNTNASKSRDMEASSAGTVTNEQSTRVQAEASTTKTPSPLANKGGPANKQYTPEGDASGGGETNASGKKKKARRNGRDDDASVSETISDNGIVRSEEEGEDVDIDNMNTTAAQSGTDDMINVSGNDGSDSKGNKKHDATDSSSESKDEDSITPHGSKAPDDREGNEDDATVEIDQARHAGVQNSKHSTAPEKRDAPVTTTPAKQSPNPVATTPTFSDQNFGRSPHTPGKRGASRSPNKSKAERRKKAWVITQKYTTAVNAEIHNTMWPFLFPCHVNDHDELVISMVDCNWNSLAEATADEITANILMNWDGNSTKSHEPKAGNDMSAFMAFMEEVRSMCNLTQNVSYYI